MKLTWCQAIVLAVACRTSCAVLQQLSRLNRWSERAHATPVDGDAFVLRQYHTQFCGPSSEYTLAELQYNYMTQLTTHKGQVVCNKVVVNQTDGTYIVDSCPATEAGSCPATCDDCKEDFVKYFTLDVCKDGWLLVQGEATEECGPDHQCRGRNVVDVGLARWCDQWPVLDSEAKTSDELTNATL
mmetsp:Transcript_25195/g.57956  ORF Transcript_25195/g.57956 Transcript_25195/m.57956 type:complete len:185 (+) Transcript_25195:30-584(+)